VIAASTSENRTQRAGTGIAFWTAVQEVVLSRSGSQTVKRLPDPGAHLREQDQTNRRPLDAQRDAQPILRPVATASAQLREDWFERTYERVRNFLDEMFP